MRYESTPGSARVGLLTAALRLPGCSSLKDKRSRLRRLLRDLYDLRLSASEVGMQDRTDSAVIACAVVSSDWAQAERRLGRVQDLLYAHPDLDVVDSWTERLV